MIDYELTEQEKQLKAKTAELAIKDIAPQAKKLDEATKAESAHESQSEKARPSRCA